jgi:hypothetical protein
VTTADLGTDARVSAWSANRVWQGVGVTGDVRGLDLFGETTIVVDGELQGRAARVRVKRTGGALCTVVGTDVTTERTVTGPLTRDLLGGLLASVSSPGLTAARAAAAALEPVSPVTPEVVDAWVRGMAAVLKAAGRGADRQIPGELRVTSLLGVRRAVAWSAQEQVFRTVTTPFCRVRVTVSRNGLSGVESWGGDGLPDVGTAEALGAEAARRHSDLVRAVPVPNAPAGVVLSGRAAGYLVHEAIGHALEGTRASAGNALRQNGGRALDPVLTVVEDAGSPHAWVSARYDDEGTATSPVVLVAEGKVVDTLTMTRERSLSGMYRGGNGRRSSLSVARPRMRHTVLVPGVEDADRIVGSVRSGIYVDEVDFASADPRSGGFTLRAERARLIDRGALGPPLRPHFLRGSVAELQHVDALASDAAVDRGMCGRGGQWVPVSYSAPTMRLTGLTVVGDPRG